MNKAVILRGLEQYLRMLHPDNKNVRKERAKVQKQIKEIKKYGYVEYDLDWEWDVKLRLGVK